MKGLSRVAKGLQYPLVSSNVTQAIFRVIIYLKFKYNWTALVFIYKMWQHGAKEKTTLERFPPGESICGQSPVFLYFG